MCILDCYLIREDKQFFYLGTIHAWRCAFGAFPGPEDGSCMLGPADSELLAMRLEEPGVSLDECRTIASKIIEWSCGKSFRFITDLDPEIEPGVSPAPITGSRY